MDFFKMTVYRIMYHFMHFSITPPEVTFMGETSARLFDGAMSYIKLQQVSLKLH